ncbi:MAG TPA: phospholipase D-like domain-containing protein [Roseiflexaceae bacterium]|nr:phospholipase D-like domain-containing protein [Roseiflexaceae bacterium]
MSSPTNAIDLLIDLYCPTALPLKAEPGDAVPQQKTKQQMGNHSAQAYINGLDFFKAIDQEITNLASSKARGRFFYMTAWWLGLIDYQKDVDIQHRGLIMQDGKPVTEVLWRYPLNVEKFMMPLSNQSLLERLRDLARSGVTVRVMASASPFVTIPEVGKEIGITAFHTLLSVRELRQRPFDPGDVMINCLSHSLGSAHCKLIICGEQPEGQSTTNIRAYTSGLDPEASRLEPPAQKYGWHDAGVKIEGAAAGAIHDFFKSMWEAQRVSPVERFNLNGEDIVTHDPQAGPLLSRDAAGLPTGSGKQHVQVLRTVPQMNFNKAGPKRRGQLLLPKASPFKQYVLGVLANRSKFVRPPIKFAPKGLFEFKVALRKAIEHAEHYIFIADQGLQSFEVMDWIHDRMLKRPLLKVILLYGPDPHDPPNNFLIEAINKHLLPGLPVDEKNKPKNLVLYQWKKRCVHAKVTIVDDFWCCIGSANCMRRSLYTDIELSVSILEMVTPEALLPTTAADEADPAKSKLNPKPMSPSFVQRFRRDMWINYCRTNHPESRAQLLPLTHALNIWDDRWGKFGGPTLDPYDLVQEDLPLVGEQQPGEEVQPPGFSQLEYDIKDADSRQPF